MSPLFLLAAFVCGSPSGPEISFDLKRAESVNAGSMMQAQKEDPDIVLALQKAFARYPSDFLQREVKTVYVVSSMKTEEGVEYGGTVGDDGHSVILAVEDVALDWIESTFHHETAHLLLEHHETFSRAKWDQTAALSFRYDHAEDRGYGALKSGTVDDLPNPTLNAQGLLNSYGASCFDEDFATYAAGVVGESEEFEALKKSYPRIAKRAAIVEAWYEGLNAKRFNRP